MSISLLRTFRWRLLLALSALVFGLSACGGGGGGGDGGPSGPPDTGPPPPSAAPVTQAEAARFLSQTTFGPTPTDTAAVVEAGLEQWFLRQLQQPPSLLLPLVEQELPENGFLDEDRGDPRLLFTKSFWRTAIEGEDQLRQRMAFALSQLLVVSDNSNLAVVPQAVAQYADILSTHAFGNYRELLQDVTYSPAMGIFLTYVQNQKADPATGRVPDENYARELMQLFTIGLVALAPDGTPLTDADGAARELYDNDDITGLAAVFTGLDFAGGNFSTPLRRLPATAFSTPMEMSDTFHELRETRFLDTVIPAGTPGNECIAMALDAIFAHPNVGPFVARQLIQRFVTSAPEPAYVERVAAAFDAGRYQMPSGRQVGDGRRGDLSATLAAILFDTQARSATARAAPTFGKLREPVLRFTHWARGFRVNSADAGDLPLLYDTSDSIWLGQHPYRAPSVFNFYRPGYIAPGTESGSAGLTVPELQITNATSIVGYANFITAFALDRAQPGTGNAGASFQPDYGEELPLVDDPQALVEHLDAKLAHGSLAPATRARIADLVAALPAESAADRQARIQIAVVLVMTTPEYIVLR
ncbi:MAG: DUF1800 domain-containing protein [Halioglobus sp.]|nr:DUF1800 domain-containing protein [Halioglobus sp.]